MDQYSSKIKTIIQIDFSLDSFNQLIFVDGRMNEFLVEKIVKENPYTTQGFFSIKDDYYFSIIFKNIHYLYNLSKETKVVSDYIIDLLASEKIYLDPMTKIVPIAMLYNSLNAMFQTRVTMTLNWKANIKRRIRSIQSPTEANITLGAVRTIRQYHGNFYHGFGSNGKYNIIGLFISKKCVLKIIWKVNATYDIEMTNVGIPFHYEDNPEHYMKYAKKTYKKIESYLKSAGYATKLREKNIFINSMRPIRFKGDMSDIEFPTIVSRKMDGVRCQLIYENSKWVPYSRKGHVLQNVSSLANVTKVFPPSLKHFVLNIEIMWINHTLNQLTGVLNSDIIPEGFYNELRFYLFDMTPRYVKKYFILDSNLKIVREQELDFFIDRLNNVILCNQYFIRSKLDPLKLIRAVDIRMLENKEDVETMYKDILAEGGEGIVFTSDFKSTYSPGKSQKIFKKKMYKDIEVVLHNIISGSGTHIHRAVGQFRYKGKAYTGMIMGDAETSAKYLKSKSNYVGKIVTVRVIASENIRHPVIIDMQPYK